MNENDKQVSGMEATANPVPSTGRRRLVKGAMLATPAVMTLMSGRLASATSVACAARPGSIAAPGTILYEETDDGVVTQYIIGENYEIVKAVTENGSNTVYSSASEDEIAFVLAQEKNRGVGSCLASFS